jgi:hypothetical protein
MVDKPFGGSWLNVGVTDLDGECCGPAGIIPQHFTLYQHDDSVLLNGIGGLEKETPPMYTRSLCAYMIHMNWIEFGPADLTVVLW